MTTQINPATQVANGTLPAGVTATTATNATNSTNAISLNGIGTAANFNADFASIVGSPSQAFYVANASTASQAVALGQFTAGQGLGTTGAQPLPGGLILKWGQFAVGGSGTFTVTYPTAFPNGTVYANYIATANNGVADSNNLVTALSAAAFNGTVQNGAAATLYWFAIGY